MVCTIERPHGPNSVESPATTEAATCTPSPGSVDCTLGTVTTTTPVTVDILVAPIAPGTLTDSASVSPTDSNPSNNDATQDTTSQGPACTRVGTWGDDVMTGTLSADVLCGLGGNDTISGGGRSDVIDGGSGADQLSGVGGVDLLFGGTDDDMLSGDKGDDFLSGGAGVDDLIGGPGANTCLLGADGGTADCPGRTRSDAEGDAGGPLDLSQAVVVRKSGLTVRLLTFKNWSPLSIWDRGFFFVWLDTMGNGSPDYDLLVRSTRTRMRALLFQVGDNTPLLRFTVSRPNLHAVSVPVPLDAMTFDVGRTYVRWSAESEWNDTPCARPCFDLLPDAGMPPEPLQ
jgi:hemolysin type calcium-binding protein